MERRKFQRVNVDFDAEYLNPKKENSWEKALCRDISGGGARFSLKEHLPPDENLHIRIYKKTTLETITVKGKVVWTKEHSEYGYESGLQFHDSEENYEFTSFICDLVMQHGMNNQEKESDLFNE